jgi:hypothetical protein
MLKCLLKVDMLWELAVVPIDNQMLTTWEIFDFLSSIVMQLVDLLDLPTMACVLCLARLI